MYFGLNADTDSLVYLMLANDFLHKKYPQIITIAEVLYPKTATTYVFEIVIFVKKS